jgi:Flp pilus assembly protein TadB
VTYLDELRARRGDPDDPFDQDAARREYKRDLRRSDRKKNDEARDIYNAGRREERDRHKAKHAKTKRPANKRRPTSRRRSSSARDLKRGAQSLASPVRAQISSGVQFLGLSMAVAALYLVLTSEEQTGAFSKALGGLQSAVRWLSDPTAAVPFGHDHTE